MRTACSCSSSTPAARTRIAENEYFGHTPFISHNWSPDSQWLAYTQNSNGLIQTVHVYSIAQRKSFRITDGLTEVSEPVFDRNGRYLYVIASDQAGPVKDWFSLASLDLTFTHSLYAIVLRKGDASPLPLEGETAAEPAAGTTTTIDFDGIGDRIVPLPTGGATLRGLQVGKSGELYYLWTPATPAINALNTPGELKRFVMKERTAKTLIAGVDAYFVSADGEKVLLRQGKSSEGRARRRRDQTGERDGRAGRGRLDHDRPARGMAADPARGLAAQPRFLLRAELSRHRLERDVEEVRAVPRSRRDAQRRRPHHGGDGERAARRPQLQRRTANRSTSRRRSASGCSAPTSKSPTAAIDSRRSSAAWTGALICARRCARPASQSRTANTCWPSTASS